MRILHASIALATFLSSLASAPNARGEEALRIEASPPDQAVLVEPPERATVRFSRGIDARSMRIALEGPKDSSSLDIEGSGAEPIRELSIAVPDEGRGSYVVRWEIESVTGERLRGRVRFVVRR